MQKLSELSLVPVVNFHPHYLGSENYPNLKDLPNGMDIKHKFWVTQMEKWELENMEPIRIGMEYVPLSHFYENDIIKLLRWQLGDPHLTPKDMAMYNSLDFNNLQGGVTMCSGNDILIIPQCCVSLQDYKEWMQLGDTKKFKPIWIGHPWVYYKTSRKEVFISEYLEKDFNGNWKHHHPEAFNYCWGDSTIINKEAINHTMVRFRISKSVYYSAVLNMQKEIEIFKSKVIQVAQRLNLNEPEIIANNLVCGNGGRSYSLGYADL